MSTVKHACSNTLPLNKAYIYIHDKSMINCIMTYITTYHNDLLNEFHNVLHNDSHKEKFEDF